MINAIEWFKEKGFTFDDKITIKDVTDLQSDALWHAARAVHDMSRGTTSEDRAAAIDEARDLIADIARNATCVTAQPNAEVSGRRADDSRLQPGREPAVRSTDGFCDL